MSLIDQLSVIILLMKVHEIGKYMIKLVLHLLVLYGQQLQIQRYYIHDHNKE